MAGEDGGSWTARCAWPAGFQGQLCALRGGQTGAIPGEGKPREAGGGGEQPKGSGFAGLCLGSTDALEERGERLMVTGRLKERRRPEGLFGST